MSKPTAPERKRIAVIDVDSIVYAVACTSEAVELEGGEFLPLISAEEAYDKVVDRIAALVKRVGADTALICMSMTNCFRYKLLPTYKGNRTNRKPTVLLELQRLLVDRKPWPTMQVKGLEADDVAGIASGHYQMSGSLEPVLCSIDKDLRQIPGLLFQGDEIEEITREYGDRWHLYQALVGDTTDNYTGCPGVGPKKAEAILSRSDDPEVRWANVLAAFTDRGYSEEYALTQARVSRILRASDWNTITREPILWEPPLACANTASKRAAA